MRKQKILSLVSLLMVALLIFGCVGCGPSNDEGGASSAITGDEVSTPSSSDLPSAETTSGTQTGDTTTTQKTPNQNATSQRITTTKKDPTPSKAPENAGNSIDAGVAVGGSSNIAMPKANLKNKTVTVFSWRDQLRTPPFPPVRSRMSRQYTRRRV